MIGLLFLLIALPFRVLFLIVRVMSELLEQAAHRRGHRRHRSPGQATTGRLSCGDIARQRRFWQVIPVLLVIGFIGAHPVTSMILAVLGLSAVLLIQRHKSQRETESQQQHEAEAEARRTHANALAALHPEDIQWLRAAGWNGPGARGSDTLTR